MKIFIFSYILVFDSLTKSKQVAACVEGKYIGRHSEVLRLKVRNTLKEIRLNFVQVRELTKVVNFPREN